MFLLFLVIGFYVSNHSVFDYVDSDVDVDSFTLPGGVDPNDKLSVTSVYSHNGGIDIIDEKFGDEFFEIVRGIGYVVAGEAFQKISGEDSKDLIASPSIMNQYILLEGLYRNFGWGVDVSRTRGDVSDKVPFNVVNVSSDICTLNLTPDTPFNMKSIDACKSSVGVEIQFGKYAFGMYDFIKFRHFIRAGRIDVGVEIVPDTELQRAMSSGVCSFEQMASELDTLNSDDDPPMVLLGVSFGESVFNSDEKSDIDVSSVSCSYNMQTKIGSFSSD